MEGTTPDRPAGGIPEDPELRDPVLPAPEPVSGKSERAKEPVSDGPERAKEPASGGPPGSGGSVRGSLRRRQWTDPPVGDRPDGKAGEDGDVVGPAASGSHRITMGAAVLVASALLFGLGGAVAVAVHGHGKDTLKRASENMGAGSQVAPDHPVQAHLPWATPVPSVQSKAPKEKHAPPPAMRRTSSKLTVLAPLGFWRIGSGGAPLGADATNAYPLTVDDVAPGVGHGGCGVFNGSYSELMTAGPVLATGPGASFTVSAWVYLTGTSSFATAVSQDGETASAFYLQYSQPNNRWAFARGARALSSAAPTLRTWTHLVGVYKAGSGQLTLYVNGVRQGIAHDTSPLASTGVLAIGRGKYGGHYADWFPGQINDVEVFGKALTAGQIRKL